MMCHDSATLFGPFFWLQNEGGVEKLFFIIPPMQNPLEIEKGEVIPAKQKSIPSNGRRERKQEKREKREAKMRQEIKMPPHASC